MSLIILSLSCSNTEDCAKYLNMAPLLYKVLQHARQQCSYTKKYVHKEHHRVCPLVGIGTLPTPLSPASVPLPPEPKGGGGHSPVGEGLGECLSNSDDWRKRLALCLLCVVYQLVSFVVI
jgi:hypothetical protein